MMTQRPFGRRRIEFFLIISFFPLISSLFPLACLYAEDVTISTYYPSPHGIYGRIRVLENNDDPALTVFTRALLQAGLLITTDYAAGNFTPGVFWSTSNDNALRPKAGIWMQENANASLLYLGTSNNYATGITSSVVIDQNGDVGINTAAPAGPLHVAGNDDATSSVVFVPGANTANPGVPAIRVGIGTAAPASLLHAVGVDDADSRVLLAPGTDTAAAGTPRIQLGIGTAAPNPSAVLDLTSTSQALLVPRLNTTQRDAIPSADRADGMILYNTTLDQFEGFKTNAMPVGSFMGTQVGAQIVRTKNGSASGTTTYLVDLSPNYSTAKKVLLQSLAEMKGDDGVTRVVYDFLNSSGTALMSVTGVSFTNITEARLGGTEASLLMDIPTLATRLRISLTVSRDSGLAVSAANHNAVATVTFYR